MTASDRDPRAKGLAFSSLRVAAMAVGAVVTSSLGAAPALAGVWVAGDLHVHTTYSHDSYGGPGDDNTGIDDANTYGLTVADEFRLASTRGLDYLAITDHNDIRSQSDPGFPATRTR